MTDSTPNEILEREREGGKWRRKLKKAKESEYSHAFYTVTPEAIGATGPMRQSTTRRSFKVGKVTITEEGKGRNMGMTTTKKGKGLLTGKKPGGMGPPGVMPSFGGIWPSGDGAGPAF